MKLQRVKVEVYKVPHHAVTWFLYGDCDTVTDTEIGIYMEFLKENELRAVDTVPEMFDEHARCDVSNEFTAVTGILFQVLRE